MDDVIEGAIVKRESEPRKAIVKVNGAGAIVAAITEAQASVLQQRTPAHAIKYRKGKGGAQQAYVEGGWVTSQLNLAFGWDWDFEVIQSMYPDDIWTYDYEKLKNINLSVLGRLTVRTPDGRTIKKEQFGECNWLGDLGNTLKGAATDSLKKCASQLGIALDLQSADERAASTHPQRDAYWGAVHAEGHDFERALQGDAWAIDRFQKTSDASAWQKALAVLRKEKESKENKKDE